MIRNDTGWDHPMHLHGHSFRLLSRNGNPEPHKPWLDTVLMHLDETVDFQAFLTVFDSELSTGVQQTAADLKFGWAWRMADSRWSFLDRMDLVYEDAKGDGTESKSWRFINNFNANRRFGARTQLSLQYAFKYVRDEFDADAFTGYSDLAGFDLRRSINGRWDVGVNASVFNAYESGTRDYSVGADVGLNLATNMWISLGYNVTGFHDDDFAAAKYSAQGPYIRFTIKADQRTLKDIAGIR